MQVRAQVRVTAELVRRNMSLTVYAQEAHAQAREELRVW